MLSATFGSALSIGGAGSDAVYDMQADAAGNSYVTGSFSGTVDFDLSQAHAGDADILTSRGSSDAFVAKYAPDDSLVWVRRMGGDAVNAYNTDAGRYLSLDVAGNVYVTGEFQESADFGSTTLVSAGGKDAFLAKFSAAGNQTWAKRWGTAAGDAVYGSGVDASGNVYALFRVSAGYNIVKFNASGSQKWSAAITGSMGGGHDLAVSPSGNVIVVGDFFGTVDFDPSSKVKYVSSGTINGYSAFVLNLDTNGKYKWVTPFAGRTTGSSWGFSMATSVALDGSGNVYVGGAYHNTVDFNPGLATTSLDPAGGAYIAKLNSSGGLVWVRGLTTSPTSHAWVYGIDIDAAGRIYAAGNFTSSIDLNPGAGADVRTTAGDHDIFVVQLSSTGAYEWGETFGGVGTDVVYGVDVDNAGFIHLAGYFADVVDFDPNPLSSHTLGAPGAGRDGFRLRLQRS